jgi:hypothetical protein
MTSSWGWSIADGTRSLIFYVCGLRSASGALDVGSSDCRHLALLRAPAWSECRHNFASNMHAFEASLYLAISTIDAMALRTNEFWSQRQQRQDEA